MIHRRDVLYANIENKMKSPSSIPKHISVEYLADRPGEEASGMAFDAEHHRLFIGCHIN